MGGADAEDEADGVHEIGLTGAVGADDGREVVEGADGLEALVGLEVLELEAEDLAGGDEGRHGGAEEGGFTNLGKGGGLGFQFEGNFGERRR